MEEMLEVFEKEEEIKVEGKVGKNPNASFQEWIDKLPEGIDLRDVDIFLGSDGFYHWRIVRDPKNISDFQERQEQDKYLEEKRKWTGV